MLQRILTALTTIEGVEQAMLLDNRGEMLAYVGKQGKIPPTDDTISLINIANETVSVFDAGQIFEIWSEDGDELLMIDFVGPGRIVALSGTRGRLARWRHGLDRDRKILATTPRM